MNNKGFTLVETLAVLVILGIVLSIGGYSIVNYLSFSKEKSLNMFKENVKSGMINYYNECKYMSPTDNICKLNGISVIDYNNNNNNNTLTTTVAKLAEYGFLENQGKKEDDVLIVKNPITNKVINDCKVSITYNKTNQEFGVVTYSAPEGMENTNVCTSLNS